jgi:PTH1 family peptidyl-tRNA hydrolase
MNNSGAAVVKFVQKTDVGKLIVLHDDIDLPFGEIKVSKGRGDGGNNGIKSIISKLGSKDFVRIRIGIAPTSFWTGKTKRPLGGGPLERFVLQSFSKKEAEQLSHIYEHVFNALQEILKNGPEAAMNTFN